MTVAMGDAPEPRPMFRALLLLFPATFRRECGADYLRFLHCQRQERRYAGLLGALAFWREALADALRTGARMRWRRNGGRDGSRRPISAAGRAAPGSSPSPISPRPNGSARAASPLDSLRQDFRYALRSLAATPGFAAVAVVTLALGIGANTAIFTVVDSVLLRDLPYADADELVLLQRGADVTAASWPDFRDWRAELTSFSGIAGAVHFSTDIQWDDGTRSHNGAAVSHDLFDILGVSPELGRGFTEEEDTMGGPQAVVLGHDLFAQHLGGDPAAIGRSVVLSGEPHRLVGVMPVGFDHPGGDDVEFWIPMRGDQLLIDSGLPANARGLGFINVIARRRAGVSLDAAEAEARAVVAAIDAEHSPDRQGPVDLVSLHEATVGDVRAALLLVLAAVGLVLAIACANVANLSLSKASARRREVAVRAALGAPRARLIGQECLESTIVAATGGLLGAALAFVFTDLLLALAPAWLPRIDEVGVDASVLAFTAAVSLLAAILSGVLPALRSSKARPDAVLGAETRGSTRATRGLRAHNLLVGLQIALAVLLLTLAALLGNSFVRLLNVDPGFDPDDMLRASLGAPAGLEDDVGAVLAFYDEVLLAVRALPGVRGATLTYSPPFGSNEFRQTVLAEDMDPDPEPEARQWVGVVIVGDGYFDTLGIQLTRGRAFGPLDRRGGPPVAVVNRAMAERFWPGEDALGKRFRLTDGISGSLDSFDDEFFPDDWFTVVGVAADVRRLALDQPAEPEFYRPHAQMAWGSQYLLVRTTEDPGNVAELIRESIWSVDPTTSINGLGTVRAWMSDNVAEPRFRAVLIGAFALLATTLAMVGVYAVMAWAVVQRTREIGVRIALGARAGTVLGQVLRRGLAITAAGAVFGLVAAVGIAHAVAATLFEVSPADPWTLAAVVALVVFVSLVACWVPARRASRVDPLIALRAW